MDYGCAIQEVMKPKQQHISASMLEFSQKKNVTSHMYEIAVKSFLKSYKLL